MKSWVLALTLAGCTVSQPSPQASSTVALTAPLIPFCVFACEIRTADGTTTILRQSDH